MHPFLGLPNTHLLLYPNIGAFSVRLTQHEKLTGTYSNRMQKAIGDTDVTFINYGNFYYSAPLYLGSGLLKFKLLYDTGSPETTIAVKDCLECKGKKYDYTTSNTFTWTAEARTIEYYDGAIYNGRRCKEKACATNNSGACIPQFQMLCIEES